MNFCSRFLRLSVFPSALSNKDPQNDLTRKKVFAADYFLAFKQASYCVFGDYICFLIWVSRAPRRIGFTAAGVIASVKLSFLKICMKCNTNLFDALSARFLL